MRMCSFAYCVVLSILMQGCAGGAAVRSSIESYSSLPQTGQGKTIAILPTKNELLGTLEFKANSSKLAQRFTAKGFGVVDAQTTKPDYVAFFAYGIDDGKLVQNTFAIPEWGVTGYSGANTYGTVNVYGDSATYNSQTTLTPQYGITGYQSGVRTDQIFTRAVVLDIYETSKMDIASKNIANAQVYSGKLKSAGTCGNISGVLDVLLDSLFKDFPGSNGSSKTVELPFKQPSC